MMLGDCLYDWHALAPMWDLFENDGLSPDLLAGCVGAFAHPILLVGCGRGGLLHWMQRQCGADAVFGVDIAPEMVAAARERGCRNVCVVLPTQPVPAGLRFGTIVVATGVLDPLDGAEVQALLATLHAGLQPGGALWLHVFGRFGPHWSAAETLRAAVPLGISNERLFSLYAASIAAPRSWLAQHALCGRDAMVARVWMRAIGRWVQAMADARGCPPQEALGLVRHAFPAVQRRFHTDDLRTAARRTGLQAEPPSLHQRAGVLQLCCRTATA